MADFRFTVTPEEDGQEIRVLMRRHFDFSSRLRGRIKRQKLVRRNGAFAEGWHRAAAGDVISVDLPEETSHFEPENIPLFPVYEDGDLLVLNKQPGVVVHPTRGHLEGTVANGLIHHMAKTGSPFKIRFVNRLDMDTSGLLVVAKNAYAQTDYIRQSDSGQVIKAYTALVHGIPDAASGVIDLPIAPPLPGEKNRRVSEDGAASVTHYTVQESFPAPDGAFSVLRLRLETGRTHQIRVHLSHIGHPVAGDALYGGQAPDLISRQALHASFLRFLHPITKEELRLEAPLPDDMLNAMNQLRRRCLCPRL
ncbi:MAG: RluA family pseudouridine synthase [Bacillota bacterium]|nr:RluA family pseudouridine synthase [Bacillota bacterium]